MYWLAGGRRAVLSGGHQAEAEEDDEDSELHHGQSGLQSQSQPAGICNLSAAPWLAVLQYCTWLSLVKVFMSTMQMSSAAVYLTPLKKRNATTFDIYQIFLIFDFLRAEQTFRGFLAFIQSPILWMFKNNMMQMLEVSRIRIFLIFSTLWKRAKGEIFHSPIEW